MYSELAESWANESDQEVREALGRLDDYKSEAADIIRLEAEKRGINISVSLVAKSHHRQNRGGLLHRLFTKQNLSVGWSSFWLGLVTGIPLTLITYSLLVVSAVVSYVCTAVVGLVLLLVAITWSWRHLECHGWVAHWFLSVLVAHWIVFCPLNLTFSLSSRRAVHRHRGIEVAPFSYGGNFFLFAVLLAVTWLVTGLPLGLLLDLAGEPGTVQLSVFGLWLLVVPVVTMFLFGHFINDLANNYGRARSRGMNTTG